MRADTAILELIPHRPPMLLIQRLVSVSTSAAKARVNITADSPFFIPDKGVPAWVGLEYMGQTAALIAGYQQAQHALDPHLGMLLGTRKFASTQAWFKAGAELLISCSQLAVVGNSLATFSCEITDPDNRRSYAEAKLSVYRKPIAAMEG